MKADFYTAMGYFVSLFVFTAAVWTGTWKLNKSVRILLRAVVVAILSAPIIPYRFGGRSTAESLPFAALFDPIQALSYPQLRAIGITWIIAVPILWTIDLLIAWVVGSMNRDKPPNWAGGGLLGIASAFIAMWLSAVSMYFMDIWLGRGQSGEFLNDLTFPLIALLIAFGCVLMVLKGFISAKPISPRGKLAYLLIFGSPVGCAFLLATYLLLMRFVIAWGHA